MSAVGVKYISPKGEPMKTKRRRRDDSGSERGVIIFLWRHAKDVAGVVVLLGMMIAGLSHFATAADVEQKFTAIKIELKTVALEARRQRIEDELFRLRSDTKQKGTMPQIERYESELRDVSARLRQLDERRP